MSGPALTFRAAMLGTAVRHWWPVSRLAASPERAQLDALRRILRSNAATRFGVEHGFDRITSPDEYRERVPVQQYETLRPYVEEQRTAGTPALTVEQPMFYAQTSGSTGQPKLVPVTPTAIRQHKAEQALFTFLQYRARPGAFAGKALGVMGAAVEGRLDSGHAVGSVSGYLYESLPAALQSRLVIPPAISTIHDYDLKYFVIVCLALAERNVTYLGSPNPSTFIRLQTVLNEHRDALARSLESGRLERIDELDAATRAIVAGRIRPDAARARELRSDRPLTFAALWPHIRLLTTWTGGSCGVALDKLRGSLPAGTAIMELGYQATECRGTLALDAGTNGGLPPLHHHYFEFVEQRAWEDGAPTFLDMAQLESGGRYYVLITTHAGLYRYFMNDLLEVVGWYRRTPLLRFLQKGRGVTNLTGEKLYEAQVIQAVQTAAARHGMVASFFIAVADEQHARYTLFLERDHQTAVAGDIMAADIDRAICTLNVEYESKRASGRLPPLTLSWIAPAAAEAYKRACVGKGQREGQFKPAVLQYKKDLPLAFEAYVVT